MNGGGGFDNRLRRAVRQVEKLPRFLRQRFLGRAIGRTIPFVGTAGLRAVGVSPDRVIFELPDRKRIRNHIGTPHAAAAALLAETASGLAFGMHVPDNRVPLLKSMQVDYERRMVGSLRAEASINGEDIENIRTEERGDCLVNVTVTDASGEQPVQCRMRWAWVPTHQ